MNPVWSYLTLLVSRLLNPREREVALGDVAELGFAGRRAFAGVLGLVVRRHVDPWKRPRTWFVLLALVLPIATLLAFSSNTLSAQLFPTVVMWWRHHATYATGVTAGAEVFGYFFEVAAIVLGSWSCGFVAGALSRGTWVIDGALFCVTLIVGMCAPGTPFSRITFCCSRWGLLPVLMAVVFILAPAFWGLRLGAGGWTIRMRGLVFLIVGSGVVDVLAAWVQGWGAAAMENWSRAGSPLTLAQLLRSGSAWGAVGGYSVAIVILVLPTFCLVMDRAIRDYRLVGKG